ncbi:MAG TPA: hypothetical protein V6D17_20150 [Candidatus Obscuribacterales bacterium]
MTYKIQLIAQDGRTIREWITDRQTPIWDGNVLSFHTPDWTRIQISPGVLGLLVEQTAPSGFQSKS